MTRKEIIEKFSEKLCGLGFKKRQIEAIECVSRRYGWVLKSVTHRGIISTAKFKTDSSRLFLSYRELEELVSAKLYMTVYVANGDVCHTVLIESNI